MGHGYPPPPPKKGVSAGKVVLIIFAVFAVLGIGTCGVCTMAVGAGAEAVADAEKERQAKEEKAKVDAEKCRDSETVSWAAVAQGLKENEAKVASAWKGSCAKISGVVDSINSGFDDKPVVMVGTGERFSLQDLHCKPKDEKKALELKKGQQITVWGVGGGEVLGSLFLEHCDW